jgi:hypothetical protein
MAASFQSEKDQMNASTAEHSTEGSRPQVQRITKQVLLGAGQLLLAGSTAILWQFCAHWLGWAGDRFYPDIPAGIQVFNACMIAALGFFSAWLIFKLYPAVATSGRWIWLPLAALLALLIGWDALDGWDWRLISDHYFWEYPAQKLAPIERDILTYPALSAVAYSLGVLTRRAREK